MAALGGFGYLSRRGLDYHRAVLLARRALWLTILLVLVGCSSRPGQPNVEPDAEGRMHTERADLVLRGGVVVSGVAGKTPAEAIAIRRGKVLWVGDSLGVDALIDVDTQVIDLAGAVVLPGLVDAHAHLAGLGAALDSIDLSAASSWQEVLARVTEAAKQQPNGWILGRGWDQNDWSDKAFPDGNGLEAAAPGRTVWLVRVDGHAGVASPAAMIAAGLSPRPANATKTKDDESAAGKGPGKGAGKADASDEEPKAPKLVDPDGGTIVRDGQGWPTGVFVDNAMALIADKIPPAAIDVQRKRLERAMTTAVTVGITGVHDMGVSSATLALFDELDKAGKLPLRVYAVIDGNDPKIEEILEAGPRRGTNLTVRAVKFYADGALGSRGAALLADYSDQEGHRGLMVTEPERLKLQVLSAMSAGFQPCVHAIGDRANRVVLDIYQAAAKPELRPRIEHAQILSLQDLERFGKLDVIASMQPTHATSDMPWAESRLGKARLSGAYAWRSLLDTGARLAFGSDFPVERPQILEGLYAAITRQDRQGSPAGGWQPNQKLGIREALAAFTTGAAYASFSEKTRGLLKPGYDGDMTIVRGDGVAELLGGHGDPRALLAAQIALTVVGGQIRYLNEALGLQRRVGLDAKLPFEQGEPR